MSLKSGHTIVPVTGKELKKQLDEFKGHIEGLVRLEPDGWFLFLPYVSIADKVYEFKFRSTDVVVMTYPKCGTTWSQEIVYTLLKNSNFDNPKNLLPANFKSPFIEFDFLLKRPDTPEFKPGDGGMYDYVFKKLIDLNLDLSGDIFLQLVEVDDDPRIIKTHLPFSLLSPTLLDTCKVLFVARNPKDAVVSNYHHYRALKVHDFVGTLDSFVDHFINDTLLYSPFWPRLKEAWDNRHHPNLLFCYYEDFKANPKEEIRRIQQFLGTNFSEEKLEEIVEYTSFEAMKKRDHWEGVSQTEDNPAFFNQKVIKKDGGLLRKGVVGDWQKRLSQEQARKIDEWTKKNTEKFDGNFKYKIL